MIQKKNWNIFVSAIENSSVDQRSKSFCSSRKFHSFLRFGDFIIHFYGCREESVKKIVFCDLKKNDESYEKSKINVGGGYWIVLSEKTKIIDILYIPGILPRLKLYVQLPILTYLAISEQQNDPNLYLI